MTKKNEDKREKSKWEMLREPFEPEQIGKLPRRPFFINKDDWKKKKKSRCQACGGWHPDEAIHLDFVGHAATTDRLNKVDPEWTWEPFAVDQTGLPAMGNGGMWIRLTVLGVTRIGFGDAQGKSGGDAMKEIIGDAIRNAAMRFGVALDLWHKGELNPEEAEPEEPEKVWTGPIKKTAFKKILRELSQDIKQVEDSGSMNKLMSESKEIREQCETDLPDWYEAMEKAIEEAAIRVEQPKEEVSPFGFDEKFE